MKFKKIPKVIITILIIILLLFSVYYIWFKFTEKNEEEFITSDFLLMFQTKNLFTLFNKLDESQLLDTVFYNRQMKEFYKVLIDIRIQLSGTKKRVVNFINFPATVVVQKNRKPLIFFNTGLKTPLFHMTSIAMQNLFKDSRTYRFSSDRYNNHRIIRVTLLKTRESFYFTQIKNVLAVAMDKYSIQKVVDTYISGNNLMDNENYLQVKAQIGENKLLWAYFNITYILNEIKNTNPALYKSFKTLSILSIAGLDLDVEEESLKINGFYSTAVKDEKVSQLFSTSPKKVEALKILPKKTGSFVSLTFDDFQDVWAYYKQILKMTGQIDNYKKLNQTEQSISKLLNLSLNDLIFSWLSDEITIGNISGFKESVSIIAIKDKKNIDETISKLQKKHILKKFSSNKYKNNYIYQIQLSSFFQFLSGVISSDLSLPYYTIYGDFIILSQNQELIKYILDSIEKDDLLFYEDKVKKLYLSIKKGNVVTYWNLSLNPVKLFNSRNLFFKILKRYNNGMFAMEFSDSGIKNRAVMTDPITEGIRIIEGWPLKLDATIWKTPAVYNIDKKNFDEMIIAVEDGRIYLTDFFGEVQLNWPVKIDGKSTTSPFILSGENDDLIIGAISSSGKLYAWNKEAILQEGFPVDIGGDVKTAPVVGDINNDGLREVIISDDKGKIYAIDAYGRNLPGFPVQLNEKAKSDLFLIRSKIDNSKEIVCAAYSKNGYIYFINSTGAVNEEKVFASGDASHSSTIITCTPLGKLVIIQLTTDGKLFARTDDGNFLENFPLDLGNRYLNSPVAGDIDNDGNDEIVVVSDKGYLTIIELNGQRIFEQNLDFRPVQDEKLLIFDINKDGRKEIIIPDAHGYLRFYSTKGTLMFKLTGSTHPVIKDMDRDGKYELITAGDEEDVYLYKMP